MKTCVDKLREWIEHKFHDYAIDGAPVKGTYGLIWFIKAKQDNIFPQTRALKTLNPDDLIDSGNLQDVDYLKREFRMWLELPPTYNVISGIKLYIARLPITQVAFERETSFIELPVMVMERMEGDLKSWISNDKFGMTDRLFALAQAFNGLNYLYSHGIEGHGDLKPENFLYTNLRNKFSIDDKSWLYDHPWQVKVSDLGWADAWIDYGYTTKAFRQYLSPERIGRDDQVGEFIPHSSDIFSMGIITAELLQGKHPAKNFKKSIKSEGNWLRWAKKHDPDLSNIKSDRIKILIKNCLHPDYKQRPTAQKCFEEICNELREEYDLDVEPTLNLWRQDISNELGVSKVEHVSDVAIRALDLGGDQVEYIRKNLENLISTIEVTNLEGCSDWCQIANSLICIYEQKGGEKEATKIQQLRSLAAKYFTLIFENLNRVQLNTLTLPGLGQQFERLADIIMKMASIADIKYEQAATGEVVLSNFSMAAFAFGTASDKRSSCQSNTIVQHYLEEAIKYAPDEAVLFYFRAFWGYTNQHLTDILGQNNVHSINSIQEFIKDLETASNLDPLWTEPSNLLNKLRNK